MLGFALASIGGPLVLLSFLPGVAGDEGVRSAGLVVALSLAVFAVPLAIWLVFSRRVVSPGGLSAFVEAAAGRRAAVAHGWIWAFAYFLYLPYTITFVVYDLLPPVFPGVHAYRAALELVLPAAIVGAAFLVAAIPLAAVPESLRNTSVPGAAIAQAYSGRGLAVTVGILTAGGTLALVVAEYLALARLLRWLHGVPIRTSYAWIAVPFLALDAVSIAFPDRFYDDLLKPSLGALFVSQLIVFLVFPRFRRGLAAVAGALIASGLAAWGLYTLIAGSAAT